MRCRGYLLRLSPDGTLTQLQGSDSRPLARREGKWTRREGEAANIVSLEQETQLRVLRVYRGVLIYSTE
jgi:hypothetical protein